MLENTKYLSIALPEDILKREMSGNYDKALELIDRWLGRDISTAVRKRLELEKQLIPIMLGEYPYRFNEALQLLQSNIRDFTEEEFLELIDQNLFDWIYVDGELRFIRTFFENVCKVRHEITNRMITPENPEENRKKQELLNGNMNFMKQNGGNAYRFHIRATVKFNDKTARIGEPVMVHLPIPTQGLQVRNVKILSVDPQPAVIAPPDHASRTVCFQTMLEKDQTFSVEYTYETHLRYMAPEAEKVSNEQPTFCTEELAPQIVFTPFIRELYDEIVGNEKNPLRKARMIYDYITKNVRYSYVRKYIAILNIPEYTGINLKGDCGVQALLFITLCRYGNIPAKWQSGLFVTAGDIGGHDWAQFYVAPYGWMFADLSFGGSAHRIGNEERQSFYFGNLDPFRMPANSEFQHEFFVPKKFMRNDPYDNQYGECEYSDREILQNEYEAEQVVLEAEQIEWEGAKKI